MNGGEADHWSEAAAGWSASWGSVALPAWEALVAAADIRVGTRVLDVGCGSGEFLAHLADLGAVTLGSDPASGMLAVAARLAPSADLRPGGFGDLPWVPGDAEVVVAVNALQFAPDLGAALREAARVVGPGGRVGIANWADADLNGLEIIEAALAVADGDEPLPDHPTRLPGGLAAELRAAGLTEVVDGLASGSWTAPDDDSLVAAVLLGEDADGLAARRSDVLDAARHMRRADGSTVLATAFRWAVGTVGG